MIRLVLATSMALVLGCTEYKLSDDTPGDDDDTTPAADDDTDDPIPDPDDDSEPQECPEQDIPGGECWIDEECFAQEQTGTFTPVTLWSKESWATDAASHDVRMAPMVANLTDDDGDGDIDENDIPDIVVVSYGGDWAYGRLRAVAGDTGAEIWDAAVFVQGQSGVAIGDIDNDNLPEIVATTSDYQAIAFEHDGTHKWTSDSHPNRMTQYSTNPAISDMDHDGTPEIIAGAVIFNADGTTRGVGGLGSGRNPAGNVGSSSFAVDIDRDGEEEVIVGNAVYDSSGNTEYTFGEHDGYPGVGNFDADPEGEIVVVSNSHVALYDIDGTQAWQRPLPGGVNGVGGPPTIADFDGDGEAEVGVASRAAYSVFDTDGTVLWINSTQDLSSGNTGSAVFDFEGDGFAEVVYADEENLWVFAGPDGAVKLEETSHQSATWVEYPTIADVDADGHAEIIYTHNGGNGPGGTGLSVVEDANDSWMPGPAAWNQHAYFITNVEADGSIPTTAAVNWDSYNSFRSGDLVTAGNSPAYDLTGEILDVCEMECDGGTVEVYVQVCNSGTDNFSGPFPIALYSVHDDQLELVETMIYPSGLQSGTMTAGLLFELDTAAVIGKTLELVVDDVGNGTGMVYECDEDNNRSYWPTPLCI